WQPGQLESELLDNAWLTVEADAAILFHTSIAERWHKAARKLGIEMHKMVPEAGHA
ncbi:MAG: YqgE/AlgH family protein, partial [Enterobacteriaceae bacterium]